MKCGKLLSVSVVHELTAAALARCLASLLAATTTLFCASADLPSPREGDGGQGKGRTSSSRGWDCTPCTQVAAWLRSLSSCFMSTRHGQKGVHTGAAKSCGHCRQETQKHVRLAGVGGNRAHYSCPHSCRPATAAWLPLFLHHSPRPSYTHAWAPEKQRACPYAAMRMLPWYQGKTSADPDNGTPIMAQPPSLDPMHAACSCSLHGKGCICGQRVCALPRYAFNMRPTSHGRGPRPPCLSPPPSCQTGHPHYPGS